VKQFIYRKSLSFLFMLKQKLAFLVLFFSFLIFVPHASASTLYLSPGSANIPQGSTVSVSVGLNTKGESINGVTAYLNYPSDKLEVAWVSYGGSFAIAAEGTYGGGAVRISRGNISGVVGNVNIATIGFRGKTQGPATVYFAAGSGAARASDSTDSLNLGGSTGGTFTVVAAVPGGQTGTAAISPATMKDQKAPTITNINVSLISTSGATISWTTDEKADSQVEYGLQSGKYFLSLIDPNLTTNHTVKVQGTAFIPGMLYHFRVKSRDDAGNEGASNDATLQLKGYSVTIEILNINNKKPISDTQILLYGESDKTQMSANGKALFNDVSPGKHLVLMKINNNFNKAGEIDIKASPLSQSFTLNVNTGLNEAGYLYQILAIMGLIGMVVLIVAIAILRKRQKFPADNPQQPVKL
jgi:hypothetical protein